MEAQINTNTAESERIKFIRDGRSEDIFRANIFPTHPYVTFTDSKGTKIEGTNYEFNTYELKGNSEELINLTKNFIKENGWEIIE